MGGERQNHVREVRKAAAVGGRRWQILKRCWRDSQTCSPLPCGMVLSHSCKPFLGKEFVIIESCRKTAFGLVYLSSDRGYIYPQIRRPSLSGCDKEQIIVWQNHYGRALQPWTLSCLHVSFHGDKSHGSGIENKWNVSNSISSKNISQPQASRYSGNGLFPSHLNVTSWKSFLSAVLFSLWAVGFAI